MNVGIDMEKEVVTVSLTMNSITTTASLGPSAAKLLAAQLNTSADNLLDYMEGKHGPYESSDES